jgi:hypothetical protein
MKKVVWDANISMGKKSKYSSIGDFVKKSEDFHREQSRSQEYLAKAYVPMVKLLEMRLTKGLPLTVMRPLVYTTDEMQGSDGFYANSSPKFTTVKKSIFPGTQIILKEIDSGMKEFIFEDALGKSHNISFDEKALLMTQTDIFEELDKILSEIGD